MGEVMQQTLIVAREVNGSLSVSRNNSFDRWDMKRLQRSSEQTQELGAKVLRDLVEALPQIGSSPNVPKMRDIAVQLAMEEPPLPPEQFFHFACGWDRERQVYIEELLAAPRNQQIA